MREDGIVWLHLQHFWHINQDINKGWTTFLLPNFSSSSKTAHCFILMPKCFEYHDYKFMEQAHRWNQVIHALISRSHVFWLPDWHFKKNLKEKKFPGCFHLSQFESTNRAVKQNRCIPFIALVFYSTRQWREHTKEILEISLKDPSTSSHNLRGQRAILRLSETL